MNFPPRIENGRLYRGFTPVVPKAVKKRFIVKVAGETVMVCGDPDDWLSWEFEGVKVPIGFKIVDHLEKNPKDYHIIQKIATKEDVEQ